ncbi:hypothetical protein K6119_09470 [Paracrocinitomix mangrovi]|uniref:hypothetical protein n=1 Tax=Paracrocinitomix mangrovi TaxID=2862509 RepID=UPI001C8EFA71|nr:hypothetical protein [Paracrocinitomix mangrovi]UKN03719.1 hypothetical protein K6119_09470 [Paracrocinitomix mangrovi]
MKSKLLLLTILISFGAQSQDTISFQSYASVHFGLAFANDFTDMNAVLENNNVAPIINGGSNLGIEYATQIKRSNISICLNTVTLRNTASLPQTVFSISHTAISLNYGFDLIGKKKNVRLEPYLGLGISSVSMGVRSHDSTVTLSQVAQGAQDYYGDNASLGFISEYGLRFDFYPKKMKYKFGFYAFTNYQLHHNKHEWNTEGLLLNKISKLNTGIGLRANITSIVRRRKIEVH